MRLRSRLRKLEHVGGDPLADLERANPYLAVMRDAREKALAWD